MTDLPTIERALALQPGDVLVATLPRDVTPDQLDRIKVALNDEFDDIHVIVVVGIDIRAYRPMEAP